MTIRLMNIPWDQAFDVILQTQNLSVLKHGNVWLISSKSIQSNQPTITEYIRLNYALADDVATLIMGEKPSVVMSIEPITVMLFILKHHYHGPIIPRLMNLLPPLCVGHYCLSVAQ